MFNAFVGYSEMDHEIIRKFQGFDWETGQSFWVILLCALAVFAVVQTIQDMYLTPRIMGHAMGLNPAIILLALSVWGSLLGFIGLIIALPLTTLCLSYYKRFILKETQSAEGKQEKS